MTEDNFTEQDLSTNNVLYTDMIIQIMGSWFAGDIKVVTTVIDSIAKEFEDNETLMTGLLFGAILHVSMLISRMAAMESKDMEESWSMYLSEYNSYLRNHCAEIPILHPKLALKLANDTGMFDKSTDN
jgi:hypothetical protein